MEPEEVRDMNVWIKFGGLHLHKMIVEARSDFYPSARRAIAMSRFFGCEVELLWQVTREDDFIRFKVMPNTQIDNMKKRFHAIDFNDKELLVKMVKEQHSIES